MQHLLITVLLSLWAYAADCFTLGKPTVCATTLASQSNGVDVGGSSSKRAAVLATASGAWVGFEATFSPLTGQPVPLDEGLVSPDLVEWGQVPLGWEVLVLEGASDEGSVWERQQVRILPEAGCAADNLASVASSQRVDLPASSLHVLPLASGSTAHLVDCCVNRADSKTQTDRHTGQIVHCRTMFYGSDDGSGWWPGGAMTSVTGAGASANVAACDDIPSGGDELGDGFASLIVPFASKSVHVPATQKRICVDINFDPEVAAVANGGVVVSAMRKVGGDGGGENDAGRTVAAALHRMAGKGGENRQLQRTRSGSVRQLGLDASTLSAAVGGKSWAEVGSAAAATNSAWGEHTDGGRGGGVDSREVRPQDGVRVLKLRGNVEVSWGMLSGEAEEDPGRQGGGGSPSSALATDVKASAPANTVDASSTQAGNELPSAFLEVTLRYPDGTPAVSVRREFAKDGKSVASFGG